MYSDDETSSSSSENDSQISSVESDSESESEKEFVDDEVVAVRKIKVEMDDILSKPGIMSRRLNISDDPEIIDSYIDGVVSTIKNFDRLENYNVQLLSLAACYDLLYKGVVNDTNIKDFISYKIVDHVYDPIDIIRYINLYVSKK